MSETEFHVDLREYIEKILDEREKTLRLTAANLEHRLENLNALRQDVIRDREMFFTKTSAESIIERIEKIESTQGRMIGVAIALMAFSALIGAVVSHLFK